MIRLVLVLTILGGDVCANLHSLRLPADPPLAFEQNKSKDLNIILTVGENAAPNRIIINWVMKNISNVDVTTLKNGYYGGYEIEVTDDEGKAVPLTKDGENARLSGLFVSHRNYVNLKPGEEDKCEADINRMFKWQGQHHYRIAVKRQHRGNEVRSNTAEISLD
jgi:hypothetical protein